MQKILHILAHMGAARAYASASHAKRRQVGAVITHNGSPIACGWNGTPPGEPNACETPDGSATLPTVVHAEPNAYAKLEELRGFDETELFVTCLPCPSCAELIVVNGHTKRVFFGEVYRSLEGAKTLLNSGVELFFVHEFYGALSRVKSLTEDGLYLVMGYLNETEECFMSADGVIRR